MSGLPAIMTCCRRPRQGSTTMSNRLYGLVCVIGWCSGCDRAHRIDHDEIASINLTCAPTAQGVHCRLVALYRDVSRSPRDVTADASWRLAGPAGTEMAPHGVIET